MQIGYKLYENLRDRQPKEFEALQLEMALTCEKNGWCMEDGYDEDGKRYLIINPPAGANLGDIKAAKLAGFKKQRNAEEVLPIEWNGSLYDYDSNSRERMRIKRQDIEDKGGAGKILWTLADNGEIEIGLDDFKGINSVAAERSEALHIKYNTLKAHVEAAINEEELASIVW